MPSSFERDAVCPLSYESLLRSAAAAATPTPRLAPRAAPAAGCPPYVIARPPRMACSSLAASRGGLLRLLPGWLPKDWCAGTFDVKTWLMSLAWLIYLVDF